MTHKPAVEPGFAYRREHDSWREAGVDVYLCCTRPNEGFTGAAGRVHEVATRTAFAGAKAERTVAFLCGMKPMVVDVRAALAAGGVPESRTFLNF